MSLPLVIGWRPINVAFPASTVEALADGLTVKERPGHTPLKAASDLAQDLRNV